MTTFLNGIRQRLDEFKAVHPDALIAFEMGDFHELFFEDATRVAAALGIVQTSLGRRPGADDGLPMTGLPTSNLQNYIRRLECKGLKVHVVKCAERGESLGDAEAIDGDTLTDDQVRGLSHAVAAVEKRSLRAAALDARLAARGLAREAATLGIKNLTSDTQAPELDALEAIVSTLTSGGDAELAWALVEGADSQALLSALAVIHAPEGAIATGERLALVIAARQDSELAALPIDPAVGEALLQQIEQAATSLQRRRDLAEEALARLVAAGVGTTTPIN